MGSGGSMYTTGGGLVRMIRPEELATQATEVQQSLPMGGIACHVVTPSCHKVVPRRYHVRR
jgi:hypothetical protein